MNYIKDPWSLLEDEERLESQGLRPKEANIEFRAAALKSGADCRKQQTLREVTLKNIRFAEERFDA